MKYNDEMERKLESMANANITLETNVRDLSRKLKTYRKKITFLKEQCVVYKLTNTALAIQALKISDIDR